MKMRALFPSAFAIVTLGLTGCYASVGVPAPDGRPVRTDSDLSKYPISHVVLIVQENRTLNDLFATFPGADGATTGYERVHGKTVRIALKEVPLEAAMTLRHTYSGYRAAYRNGNMDGFNLIRYAQTGKPEGSAPYQYVDPLQIAPYWDMATDYALGDHLFQTQGSGSFTAHQDLIRGDTRLSTTKSLIDYPTRSPWGCPAPNGTVTSLITTALKYEENQGPAPCSSDFPEPKNYETLQNLLDAKSVSWKYYTPQWRAGTGSLWNAFLLVASVYNDPREWNAHISQPETNIFDDISHHALPEMSWVIPDAPNSDHPGYGSDRGPSWVASVVNAIGKSSYWKSTAIIVVWDDWGGFYDPVKPPKLDTQGGPGFRVPMLVISPYVPRNETSHTVYEFGSIVRFIEDAFSLGRLGTTDETSTSIVNTFDFNQSPRPFKVIPSKYSRSYFLHRKPSGLPVDTE